MRKAGYFVALSCAALGAGCGTEIARAVNIAPTADAGPPGVPEKPPQCASGKITDRLTTSTISVGEGIRYKRAGYFFGLPQDDRIALSASNTNTMVAWLNVGGTQVHVTPVTVGASGEVTRAAPDYLVDGTELSGLVALEDGFALLTRRPDPGEPIGDNATQLQATHLVRWQDADQLFAVPLTGTKSIVNADADLKRDFPNGISGRLAFNGSHYGAYFPVRGAQGDRYYGYNGDKFVQIDESGRFVNGWRYGCRQDLGNRLLPEADGFLKFCMSDGTIETPGLTLVLGPWSTRRLAYESSSDAYAGGNFGSVVKVDGGYLVAWASRGVGQNNTTPAYSFHEPAIALLDKDRMPVPPPFWPFLAKTADAGRTAPIQDAVNVHAAPYGSDKILLVWETIDSPQFRASLGYSTGNYGGTHFRFVDAQGKPASLEETLPAALAPNGPDDIVQLPNQDLLWALVPEVRDFQDPVTTTELSNIPPISEIKFVRLQYCTP